MAMALAEYQFIVGYTSTLETGGSLAPYFLALPMLMQTPSHSFCLTLAVIGAVPAFDELFRQSAHIQPKFALARTAVEVIRRLERTGWNVANDLLIDV
jgi:hypothetical protein